MNETPKFEGQWLELKQSLKGLNGFSPATFLISKYSKYWYGYARVWGRAYNGLGEAEALKKQSKMSDFEGETSQNLVKGKHGTF